MTARETRGDREQRVNIVDVNGEMLKEGHMRSKETMYHNGARAPLSWECCFFSLFPPLMIGLYSVAGRFY